MYWHTDPGFHIQPRNFQLTMSHAAVAQSGERAHGKGEVVGSIPSGGTTFPNQPQQQNTQTGPLVPRRKTCAHQGDRPETRHDRTCVFQ